MCLDGPDVQTTNFSIEIAQKYLSRFRYCPSRTRFADVKKSDMLKHRSMTKFQSSKIVLFIIDEGHDLESAMISAGIKVRLLIRSEAFSCCFTICDRLDVQP